MLLLSSTLTQPHYEKMQLPPTMLPKKDDFYQNEDFQYLYETEPRRHALETAQTNHKPYAILALQESRRNPLQEQVPISYKELMTTYAERKKPESTCEKGWSRQKVCASSLNLPNSTHPSSSGASFEVLRQSPKPVCPAKTLLIFSLI